MVLSKKSHDISKSFTVCSTDVIFYMSLQNALRTITGSISAADPYAYTIRLHGRCRLAMGGRPSLNGALAATRYAGTNCTSKHFLWNENYIYTTSLINMPSILEMHEL